METKKLIKQSGGINYFIQFGKIANLYYPHFVAVFGEGEVKIALDHTLIEGTISSELLDEVFNWSRENNELLHSEWENVVKKKKVNLYLKKAV